MDSATFRFVALRYRVIHFQYPRKLKINDPAALGAEALSLGNSQLFELTVSIPKGRLDWNPRRIILVHLTPEK
jgi:hypothetical protein